MLKKKNTTHYTKIKGIIKNTLEFLMGNPLSVLRFFLSLMVGWILFGYLYNINRVSNIMSYELSETWFIGLLPDTLLSLDMDSYIYLKIVILISSICAAFGILGRLNLIVLSILSFFLIGISEGIGVFDHQMSLTSQVILILALVPGTMKISIDYYLYKKYFKKNKKENNGVETPKWGFNLILGLLMVTYLTAGISKVRYGGFKWFDGSTLSFYLQDPTDKYPTGSRQLIIGDDNIKEIDKWKDKYGFIGHTYGNYQVNKTANKIATWISSKPFLVSFFSILTVLLEVSGFVMFFNSRFRNIFLFSIFMMHTTIGFLMGLSFRPYRLICLCLIDWKFLIMNANYQYKYIKNRIGIKTIS